MLEGILESDAPPTVRCRVCDRELAQSSLCSELRCCGTSICSGCGRSSLPGAILLDHWEGPSIGERCPRYHWSSPGVVADYWATRMDPPPSDFPEEARCVEHAHSAPHGCFGEDRDCHLAAHAGFRRSYHAARRQNLAAAIIRSLPLVIRQGAQRELARRRRRRELAGATRDPNSAASVAAAASEASLGRAIALADASVGASRMAALSSLLAMRAGAPMHVLAAAAMAAEDDAEDEARAGGGRGRA